MSVKTAKIFSVIILAVSFWTGCDHRKDHEHGEVTNGSKIALNGGKRWLADEPTRAGMRAIQEKITNFQSLQTKNPGRYADLADGIEGDIQGILKNCTMKGAGHAELHKFVAIALAEVAGMRAAGEEQKSAAFEKLRAAVDLYERYFE